MIESMNFPLLMSEMTMAQTARVEGALSAMGEEEFRAFYERTARPLWSYLSRVTGDRQKADDFLQEAYYRFYRAGRRHESEAHRRNSLFQIATNLVRDSARRARNYAEVPLDDDESSAASAPRSTAPTPEHEMAMRTDVSRAIQQLEPMQRELLWLAYAQGASHEEIAAIVGVRAISVRTLLFRAKRKLAAILNSGTSDAQQESER
jgi:RNA polymerase sigma-70 factor (ECF subfamily)